MKLLALLASISSVYAANLLQTNYFQNEGCDPAGTTNDKTCDASSAGCARPQFQTNISFAPNPVFQTIECEAVQDTFKLPASLPTDTEIIVLRYYAESTCKTTEQAASYAIRADPTKCLKSFLSEEVDDLQKNVTYFKASCEGDSKGVYFYTDAECKNQIQAATARLDASGKCLQRRTFYTAVCREKATVNTPPPVETPEPKPSSANGIKVGIVTFFAVALGLALAAF